MQSSKSQSAISIPKMVSASNSARTLALTLMLTINFTCQPHGSSLPRRTLLLNRYVALRLSDSLSVPLFQPRLPTDNKSVAFFFLRTLFLLLAYKSLHNVWFRKKFFEEKTSRLFETISNVGNSFLEVFSSCFFSHTWTSSLSRGC